MLFPLEVLDSDFEAGVRSAVDLVPGVRAGTLSITIDREPPAQVGVETVRALVELLTTVSRVLSVEEIEVVTASESIEVSVVASTQPPNGLDEGADLVSAKVLLRASALGGEVRVRREGRQRLIEMRVPLR
jgi:hypothetical protein